MPKDFTKKSFQKTLRGYAPEEVDEYLAYATREYLRLEKTSKDNERKLAIILNKLDATTNRLHEVEAELAATGSGEDRTMPDEADVDQSVKDAAERVVAEANRKADALITEARRQAGIILATARNESKLSTVDAAGKAEKILRAAQNEGERIRNEAKEATRATEALSGEIIRFRDSLFEMYNTHIELVEHAAAAAERFLKTARAQHSLEEEADAEGAEVATGTAEENGYRVKTAEEVFPSIEEAAEVFGETIEESPGEADGIPEPVGETAEEIAGRTDTAEEVSSSIEEAAEAFGETMEESPGEADEFAEAVVETVEEIGDRTETAEEISSSIEEAAEAFGDTIEEISGAAERIPDEVEEAGNEAEEAAGDTLAALEEILEEAEEGTEAIPEAAEETPEDVFEEVEAADEVIPETAGDVLDVIGEAEEETGETAADPDVPDGAADDDPVKALQDFLSEGEKAETGGGPSAKDDFLSRFPEFEELAATLAGEPVRPSQLHGLDGLDDLDDLDELDGGDAARKRPVDGYDSTPEDLFVDLAVGGGGWNEVPEDGAEPEKTEENAEDLDFDRSFSFGGSDTSKSLDEFLGQDTDAVNDALFRNIFGGSDRYVEVVSNQPTYTPEEPKKKTKPN